MNQLIIQILDDVRGAWRFRWWALGVVWLVCVVGWAFVLAMPDMYYAGSRVFVDTRTSLRPVLEGLTIEQDVDAQLNLVRQSLLGRPQLEKVAQEVGLYDPAASAQQRSQVIDKIGMAVTVDLQKERGERGERGVYFIGFKDTDRARALKVVNMLVDSFKQNALGGKREGGETARKFLRDQIAEGEQRLTAAEERLAAFKKKYVGLMPGAQGDYFTRLQREIEEVKSVNEKLAVALQRRDELTRQLRGEARTAAGTAAFSTASTETTQKIAEMETRLSEMLLRFTDKHPDVIAARETIRQLKQRGVDEQAALARGDAGALAAAGANRNPVFQSIQLALNQTDVEIAALRSELGQRESRVGELRKLVNTAPEVEAEFARLNRDYDVTRGQYIALVDRLQKSQLGEEAEQTASIRFETIDPPSASFQPFEPNRPKLLIAVLAMGLAAGLGLAYLLHQLKPVFQRSGKLAELTGLPVLGIVSHTWSARQRATNRQAHAVYALASIALLGMFVMVVQFQQTGIAIIHSLVG
jgi:polysaccharide chain length determinant protein (PEP-CTERM system associated)